MGRSSKRTVLRHGGGFFCLLLYADDIIKEGLREVRLLSIQAKLQKVLSQIQKGMHPSDLAEYIEDFTDEQKTELFALLSDEEAASIIQEMEEFDQVTLINLLTNKRASAILKEMATDDAADLISELPPEESQEILKLIDEEAGEIQGLLKYREDTAGGIMTTDFISFSQDMAVEEAIHRLREIAPEAETIYYVYVVDDEMRLIGVLSLRDLISSTDGTLLKDIMNLNVISVYVDTDQEEVARIVARYDLLAVPVVEKDSRMLGIITVDDILDVLQEEATEDIYRLAGASEVEGVELIDASVRQVVSRRLPWLFISLIGGVFAGSVIGAFENTLETLVVLAFFIPVIMDMGGNVGTQSSTIFVRGIATGEIESDEVWLYFYKEVRVGMVMGLICGIIITFVPLLWQGDIYLGLVVGFSMSITVALAALIGTLVPLLCNKAGIDPAITAGPFVTTIKDVTGLVIYFGTATIFLDLLS